MKTPKFPGECRSSGSASASMRAWKAGECASRNSSATVRWIAAKCSASSAISVEPEYGIACPPAAIGSSGGYCSITASNSRRVGCPRSRPAGVRACACALRKGSERVQLSKAARLCQVECET